MSSGPLNARQQPVTDCRLTVSIPERNTGYTRASPAFRLCSHLSSLSWPGSLSSILVPRFASPVPVTWRPSFDSRCVPVFCFSLLVTGCDAGWSSRSPCCFPCWLAMSSCRGCVPPPGSCALPRCRSLVGCFLGCDLQDRYTPCLISGFSRSFLWSLQVFLPRPDLLLSSLFLSFLVTLPSFLFVVL